METLLSPRDVASRLGIKTSEAHRLMMKLRPHVVIGTGPRPQVRIPVSTYIRYAEDGYMGPEHAEAVDDFRALLRRREIPVSDDAVHVTYVIHAPVVGVMKVGRSRRFGQRFAELSRMSPEPLIAVALYAGRDLEQKMHAVLERHRAHHEWFHETGVWELIGTERAT